MHPRAQPCVVIAGDGLAASALACVLRNKGFGVVIVAPGTGEWRRGPIVVEALAQPTMALLDDVGLAAAAHAADTVSVPGFHNRFHGADRDLGGVWTHVDRAELAHHARLQARRRGVIFLRENDIGHPTGADATSVEIRLGGTVRRVFAAIDATGRAARWSRPVRRAHPAAATLYCGPPPNTAARPGLIVGGESGWAYRLDHRTATTVGVVSEHSARRLRLTQEFTAGLDIDRRDNWVEVGVRSASVQWSVDPVAPRRLAIGDAALALSPLAGQGVRFALASALAASAVLTTWAEGRAAAARLASEYYRDFVAGARARHLTKLPALHAQSASTVTEAPRVAPTGALHFCAPSRIVGQNRAGRIVADEGFVLADGGLVRWVGGIDLAALRDAAAGGPDLPGLLDALERRGIAGRNALALIGWALRNGVLNQAATHAAANR